ncbi:MAG: hypothetical protein ABI706_16750 [Ilumatobacteraceae bacterium]
MSTVSTGVLAEWMPRLAAVQADLETFLGDAVPLLAARKSAVELLGASEGATIVSADAEAEHLAFLETLLDIEGLVRDIHRMLNTW